METGISMNMLVVERNGTVILRIKEARVDANISDDLKKELTRLYEDGKKTVLVDMTDVGFIDSSGLGAIVTGLRIAGAHRAALKLAGLKPQVRQMFELTRLNMILPIYPTTVEALETD